MYLIMSLNTYKYIWTGVDVAWRYKVTRALKNKKASEVAFVLEAIYRKGDVFKYPREFRSDNRSEFQWDVTKLLEKHSVDIQRKTTKYKHTHTALQKPLTKSSKKNFFKPIDAQEFRNPEKVSTIWVKNLYISIKTQNKRRFPWSQTMQVNWILPI